MNALLLMLLDSRSPAGGHNHSGAMEPAINAGMVRGFDDVEAFCRGRLLTTGRVNAGFAAAACRLVYDRSGDVHDAGAWADLDAEFDARTPSEAVRASSRQLGRGLMRLVRVSLPNFAAPWSVSAPHHPLVLGAAVAVAGGDPELAARAAALSTVSVPTSAAVRLLGLDPFAAAGMLARLCPDIDLLAAEVARCGDLPADTASALDLLADHHLSTEVRLFAS